MGMNYFKSKKVNSREVVLEKAAEMILYLTMLRVKYNNPETYFEFENLVPTSRTDKQMERDLFVLYRGMNGEDDNYIKLRLCGFTGWGNLDRKRNSLTLHTHINSSYEYYREFGVLSEVDKKQLIRLSDLYEKCINGYFDTYENKR